MKFNKWTLGLAALGVVSLSSAAKADEKMTAIQTALSSTTISGYVDTSAQWNFGTGNANLPPYAFGGSSKADGFNLNVVQLSISKALDESEWASGYRADLWFGPDANVLNSQSIFGSSSKANQGDFAIRQAYVALRTPVGNGIDWKLGVFDTVVGYESLESGNNPHYTRSYGFTIEPTTHTGILATYRVCDMLTLSAGIANTIGPSINERAHGPHTFNGNFPGNGNGSVAWKAESYKAYMGSIALSAPSDWGWAAGSTLYGGVVNGFNSNVGDSQLNLYVGTTIATPLAGLKVGASWDWVRAHNFASTQDTIWDVAAYASYQATEKLGFAVRGEHLNGEFPGQNLKIWAVTATVQYDLWQNVISRLELRWDHADTVPGGNTGIFGGSTANQSAVNNNVNGTVNNGGGAAGGEVDPFENNESSFVGDTFGLGGSSTPSNGSGKRNAFMAALQVIYKF